MWRKDMSLCYSPRYLRFCEQRDGSGTGTHHIILQADGGTDDSSNLCHLSVDDHKRAHEILYEDNPGNQLAQRAYSVTRGLGHPLDETTRDKIRQAHIGKPHYQSRETKQKISEALTGKPLSDEHKKSVSVTVKNLWNDPEYVKKQKEAFSKKVYKKICKTCGTPFESNAMGSRYCSRCKGEI